MQKVSLKKVLIAASFVFAVLFVSFLLEKEYFVSDKYRHFILSGVLFCFIFSFRLFLRKHLAITICLILTLRDLLLIGLLKEILDYAGWGDPDLFDFFADIIGIMFAFGGFLIVEFFVVEYNALVHDYSKKVHSTLQKIIRTEKRFWQREIRIMQHEGISFLWKL